SAYPALLHSFPTRRSSDLTLLHTARHCAGHLVPRGDPQPSEPRDARHDHHCPRKSELPVLIEVGKLPPQGTQEQPAGEDPWQGRSEEHTSELQSLTNLVCR